ncbi:hypothetical protein FKM82_003210 [Ascaphus truei]
MLSSLTSLHRMDHYMRPLCSGHNYCSMVPSLSPHSCNGPICHPEPLCACSVAAHPCATHHSLPPRCLWTSHLPHFSSISCKNVAGQKTFPCLSLLTIHETVLARRQHDGFYYLATVKQEEEQGMFLIGFNKPCAEGERYQTMLQKTEVGDIVQYLDALRHCILPGDNVLAPWEPELTRYGPGTVTMGIETRDPLRATEDEALTVSFWNGKRIKVPLGVAVWISPSAYKMIVDMLRLPISSRQKHRDTAQNSTTYVKQDRFTTVPVHMCTADHFYKHKCPHRVAHPHYTHQHCTCCCFPTHSQCTCCYDPKCQDWWPLSPTTTVYVQGRKEQEEDQHMNSIARGRESPRRVDDVHLSSSTSEEDDGSHDDDESVDETYLSHSTMVDSAVNTDSSLWEKPSYDISDRPDWKYWKQSQPEPHHRKPGSSVSSNKFKTKTSESNSSVFLPNAVGLANQRALFQTILDSPARRLTVKDVLIHKDFNPSYRQRAPPVVERLGETEMDFFCQKQASLEQQQKNKTQHLEWEQKREQEADQKYNDIQEVHRKKTLQHFKDEALKVKKQILRNEQNIKAKQDTRENHKLRTQTLAAEDKQREQRRLDHLQHVRERLDQKEYEKCAANEQKQINSLEARRRRMDNHYKQVAEKVFQAEQRETQSGSDKPQYIQA